eukprot:scaffold27478_cov20-Attheya_sp.AAC.1
MWKHVHQVLRMPGIPGFATANGRGAGEGALWTQVEGRGVGRGGRGGHIGYGRGGRGSDRGGPNKFKAKNNQFDHFDDADNVEDIEEDKEDEDVNFFADEETDKHNKHDKPKKGNTDKATSEEGKKAEKHNTENEGTDQKNDFITEEEMNRNRSNKEDTSSEMVGVQTVIPTASGRTGRP